MSKAEDILGKFKRSFNTPSTKDEKIKVVLVCIVISTTFWFFNALNKSDYVTRINYPISIQYDESEYVATASLPSRIPIEVSGGGWDLMARYFGLKMNTLEVNVERPDEDGYILASSLRPSVTPLLEPIAVNYFLQDSIKFQIERRITRSVVLSYDTSSVSVEEDFARTSEVTISPATIELIGPGSQLDVIGDTLWIRDEIRGVSEDFESAVSLPDLPDLVTSSTNSVDVSFFVVPLFAVDVSIPIERRNFPDDWEIIPNRAQVYYKVPETSFNVADTAAVNVYVDYRQMLSDSTLNIQYSLLNNKFREVRVFPQTAKASKNE
ncbi:MAG: hypothetical protein HWE21_07755 [Cytophagia bacterium]|nr:hypothetical protein [Cytophagia bacterium]